MPPLEKTSSLAGGVKTYCSEFKNARGKKICCYYWEPSEKPRALLLISHGYTEHCMIYDDLASEMARRNFFVFAHDHVGHGRSDGHRAFMYSMSHLVEDSIFHIKKIQEKYPDMPLFICGHSMGGSVTLLTSLEKEVKVSGIVLIAPALAPNPETATPVRMALAKVVSKLLPQFPITYADFRLSCRDKNSLDIMFKDPLRHQGYFKARPIVCLVSTGEEIRRKKEAVTVPMLVMHGDSDKVCHVSGSRELFDGASSTDKSIKIYSGAYHSLLQEPSDISQDVFKMTVEWLDERA